MRKLLMLLGFFFLSPFLKSQPTQLIFKPNGPGNVLSASANIVGGSSIATYYYWVVPKFVIGNGSIYGPVRVNNAPQVLTGSNYITLSWNSVPGASGYDVLRTDTPNLPLINVSIAVVLNTAGTTINDTGGALNAYTLNTYSPTTGVVYLDAVNYPDQRYIFDNTVLVPKLCFTNLTCQTTGSTLVTNGTNGQGLTSNGVGGFGTPFNLNGLAYLPITGGTVTGAITGGNLISGNGSISTPAYAFSGALTSGIYYNSGTSSIGLVYATGEYQRFGAGIGLVINHFGGGQLSFGNPVSNPDTGVARNAAGIVEINNGTAGTFRDLKLRDITINSQTGVANRPVCFDANGKIFAGTNTAGVLSCP